MEVKKRKGDTNWSERRGDGWERRRESEKARKETLRTLHCTGALRTENGTPARGQELCVTQSSVVISHRRTAWAVTCLTSLFGMGSGGPRFV